MIEAIIWTIFILAHFYILSLLLKAFICSIPMLREKECKRILSKYTRKLKKEGTESEEAT